MAIYGVTSVEPFGTYGNDEFKFTAWDLFNQNIPTNQWLPYAFCDKDTLSTDPYSDTFRFVFEQDCSDDTLVTSGTGLTYDWMII